MCGQPQVTVCNWHPCMRAAAQAVAPTAVRVQRFWRPEDLGREAGYAGGFWDVYACADSEAADVDCDDIIRKCSVLPAGSCGGARMRACCARILRPSPV